VKANERIDVWMYDDQSDELELGMAAVADFADLSVKTCDSFSGTHTKHKMRFRV
jgi:hypothetical protein